MFEEDGLIWMIDMVQHFLIRVFLIVSVGPRQDCSSYYSTSQQCWAHLKNALKLRIDFERHPRICKHFAKTRSTMVPRQMPSNLKMCVGSFVFGVHCCTFFCCASQGYCLCASLVVLSTTACAVIFGGDEVRLTAAKSNSLRTSPPVRGHLAELLKMFFETSLPNRISASERNIGRVLNHHCQT